MRGLLAVVQQRDKKRNQDEQDQIMRVNGTMTDLTVSPAAVIVSIDFFHCFVATRLQ